MDVYILMNFIWFIGWLIASGAHISACGKTGDKLRVLHFVGLYIYWPCYIGFTLG